MKHKKIQYILLISLILPFLVETSYSFPWEDQYDTYTYWGSSWTHTVNSVLGYTLNTTRGLNATSDYLTGDFDITGYAAVRLWLRTSSGATELTNGYQTINFTQTGGSYSGIQTAYLNLSETTAAINGTALEAGLYLRLGAGAWVKSFTLISYPFYATTLRNCTWTVNYWVRYLSLDLPFNFTQITTGFGNSTVYFSVSNIQLSRLDPWSRADYELLSGDFVSWLLMPWIYLLGNVAWGFGVLFGEMTLYLKYESVKLPIVFLWLFGGSGGILTVLIPAVGLHLSWFILALALGTTLWQLIR